MAIVSSLSSGTHHIILLKYYERNILFVTFISIEGIIKIFIFSNLIGELWCLFITIISNVITKRKAAVLTLNNFLNNTGILYTLAFLVFFLLLSSFLSSTFSFFLFSKTRSSPIAEVARSSLSMRLLLTLGPLHSTSEGYDSRCGMLSPFVHSHGITSCYGFVERLNWL